MNSFHHNSSHGSTSELADFEDNDSASSHLNNSATGPKKRGRPRGLRNLDNNIKSTKWSKISVSKDSQSEHLSQASGSMELDSLPAQTDLPIQRCSIRLQNINASRILKPTVVQRRVRLQLKANTSQIDFSSKSSTGDSSDNSGSDQTMRGSRQKGKKPVQKTGLSDPSSKKTPRRGRAKPDPSNLKLTRFDLIELKK